MFALRAPAARGSHVQTAFEPGRLSLDISLFFPRRSFCSTARDSHKLSQYHQYFGKKKGGSGTWREEALIDLDEHTKSGSPGAGRPGMGTH